MVEKYSHLFIKYDTCPFKTVAINIVPNEIKTTQVIGGIPECIICAFVVGRIEHYMKNPVNESTIVADLDQDCSKTFKDAHDVEICQDIVNKYASVIITLLLDKEKPEAICADIKFCGLVADETPKAPLLPEVVSPKKTTSERRASRRRRS
eukprot:gene20355-24420_t